MNRELILSIDIGSTYTKGILFRYTGSSLVPEARESLPTTVEDLTVGFKGVVEGILPGRLGKLSLEDIGKELMIRYSSSAKGGLSIAACGIVPELTARMAKASALSAGARVTSVYAYKLSKDDLEQINSVCPDIVLLAGGTDGGNESFMLHNAKRLASLRPSPVLIYAGNSKLRGDIKDLLGNRECVFAENVLPDLDNPNPEDAREKIRRIFLDRIAAGKGLGELVSLLGTAPNPTPLSVLQLVDALDTTEAMEDFMLIDMGGATTDVYSATGEEPFSAERIRKGLPEPRIKRTVEGDMGMRISAVSAAEAVGADEELSEFARRVSGDPAYLPGTDAENERKLDHRLAESICQTALKRHAGTKRRIFTARGEASLIEGKDLSRIQTVIGSGGFLSKFDGLEILPPDSSSEEITSLLPERIKYMIDKDYLIPLAANLAGDFPVQTAGCVVEHLKGIRNDEEIQDGT